MLRGLYAAASGMMAQLARQDVYANNLANVNSVGFRRSQSVLGQFAEDLSAATGGTAARASGGVVATDAGLDLTSGIISSTNRQLDLALSGNGFFVLQTPDGLAYTRDGRFTLDAQKRLRSSQGYTVLGEQGPITLLNDNLTVDTSGQISCAGQAVARLRLALPVRPRPLGNACFAAAASQPARDCQVTQGAVEQSNVNGVREMGRMMNGYRFYEANATALRYQDETLSSLMKIVQ
jgi:flagellar basal-body rod protein FlgG